MKPFPVLPILTTLRGDAVFVDGARLGAVGPDGEAWVVHRLRATSVTELRRRRLERRIAFEVACSEAKVQGFERVVGVELDARPAVVVVARPLTPLADVQAKIAADAEVCLRFFVRLAESLAAAHGEGIVHGALGPETIFVDEIGDDSVDTDVHARGFRPIISVLGLQTSPADKASWPDPVADNAADDARGLGLALASTLIPDLDRSAAIADPAHLARLKGPGGWRGMAIDLAIELLDLEPAWRPVMSEALGRLRELTVLVSPLASEALGAVEASSLVDGTSAGDGASPVEATPASTAETIDSDTTPRAPSKAASNEVAAARISGDARSTLALRGGSKTLVSESPPSAADRVREVLDRTSPPNSGHDVDDEDPDTLKVFRRRLGRFTLVRPIGSGAMGDVWLATDTDSGEPVAIKRIGSGRNPTKKARQRFRKEARLLAELRHPGIARFIDIGDDGDNQFLVTEYVEGETLSAISEVRGPLPERDAVQMMAELCRALVDVHGNGIVHRDVKPDNVMVVRGTSPPRIKLLDFGVARHLDEEGSLAMTREGAILGTPLYMSPEQAKGRAVDTRSDVYAIGVTLYQLLIGEAPFAGRGVAQVLALQIEGEVPKVSTIRSELSDEVAAVVQRCLEKNPDDRYADARQLLDALLPLMGTKATKPVAAPTDAKVFEFTWDLSSSSSALWPYVSNTERLNKAIGLAAVDESVARDGDEVVLLGAQTQAGFALAWQEQPFEWVFERRLSVVREYSQGPVAWYRSTVTLTPTGTGPQVGARPGTRLTHTIELRARGLVGRAAAAVEVGLRVRRALDRTYRRIDDLLQGHLGNIATVDAFEATPRLPADVERRFARLEQLAVKSGANPDAMARLGEYLMTAPVQEVARVRPLAMARRFGVDDDHMIEACYHAASVGLLQPMWDLLCPSCRVPASIEETLKALRDHGNCEVCNLAFALDLATTIEMVFRVHPSLRPSDLRTYCISSPAHTPHVVAQVRVPVGARETLHLALPEGAYQISGRLLPGSLAFRVRANAPEASIDVRLRDTAPTSQRLEGAERQPRLLPADAQRIVLDNDTDRAQLVRIERTTPRDDVLTASRALSSPLFRRLFPGEILAEGALVRVAAVTLLLLEVSRDQRITLAIEDLYALYRGFDELVATHGGTVVKLHGDGVLAVFDDPVAAVQAAVAVARFARDGDERGNKTPRVSIQGALHRGPAGAVALNDRIDYFGVGVQEAVSLVASARPGELLVSDQVIDDADAGIANLEALGAAALEVPALRVALLPPSSSSSSSPLPPGAFLAT